AWQLTVQIVFNHTRMHIVAPARGGFITQFLRDRLQGGGHSAPHVFAHLFADSPSIFAHLFAGLTSFRPNLSHFADVLVRRDSHPSQFGSYIFHIDSELLANFKVRIKPSRLTENQRI